MPFVPEATRYLSLAGDFTAFSAQEAAATVLEGGRLVELESVLAVQCHATAPSFGPELDEHLLLLERAVLQRETWCAARGLLRLLALCPALCGELLQLLGAEGGCPLAFSARGLAALGRGALAAERAEEEDSKSAVVALRPQGARPSDLGRDQLQQSLRKQRKQQRKQRQHQQPAEAAAAAAEASLEPQPCQDPKPSRKDPYGQQERVRGEHGDQPRKRARTKARPEQQQHRLQQQQEEEEQQQQQQEQQQQQQQQQEEREPPEPQPPWRRPSRPRAPQQDHRQQPAQRPLQPQQEQQLDEPEHPQEAPSQRTKPREQPHQPRDLPQEQVPQNLEQEQVPQQLEQPPQRQEPPQQPESLQQQQPNQECPPPRVVPNSRIEASMDASSEPEEGECVVSTPSEKSKSLEDRRPVDTTGHTAKLPAQPLELHPGLQEESRRAKESPRHRRSCSASSRGSCSCSSSEGRCSSSEGRRARSRRNWSRNSSPLEEAYDEDAVQDLLARQRRRLEEEHEEELLRLEASHQEDLQAMRKELERHLSTIAQLQLQVQLATLAGRASDMAGFAAGTAGSMGEAAAKPAPPIPAASIMEEVLEDLAALKASPKGASSSATTPELSPAKGRSPKTSDSTKKKRTKAKTRHQDLQSGEVIIQPPPNEQEDGGGSSSDTDAKEEEEDEAVPYLIPPLSARLVEAHLMQIRPVVVPRPRSRPHHDMTRAMGGILISGTSALAFSRRRHLRQEGVTHIVSCCPVDLASSEFRHLQIECEDSPNMPILRLMRTVVDFLQTKDVSKKALIHCHEGINRSATLAVAIRMSQIVRGAEQGIYHVHNSPGHLLREAWKKVADYRGSHIITNLGFQRQLLLFAHLLLLTDSQAQWPEDWGPEVWLRPESLVRLTREEALRGRRLREKVEEACREAGMCQGDYICASSRIVDLWMRRRAPLS